MANMQTTTMAPTLKASTAGLDIVDKARCKKGWTKTERAWADLATTSQATLRRFWEGVAIKSESFKEICISVGVKDWETVIDTDCDLERRETDNTVTHHNLETIARRQVSVVDNQQQVKAVVVLEGDIASIDDTFKATLEVLLKQYGGNTIQVLDIKSGSIKISISGSQEDIERLRAQISAGDLTELNGFNVKSLERVIDNADETDLRDKTSQTFSAVERRRLRQTLNALPLNIFEDLAFDLAVPDDVFLSVKNSQPERCRALLSWAESTAGIGLAKVEELLIPIISEQARSSLSYLTDIIEGEISQQTISDLQPIIQLFRQITGDDSINMTFVDNSAGMVSDKASTDVTFQNSADTVSVEDDNTKVNISEPSNISKELKLEGSLDGLRKLKALYPRELAALSSRS